MAQAIFTEPKTLKPRQIKQLEAEGYIVILVDDVDKVKLAEAPPPLPAAPDPDDGFKLNG